MILSKTIVAMKCLNIWTERGKLLRIGMKMRRELQIGRTWPSGNTLISGSSFRVSLGIIVMALLGMFNVHRHGAINSAAIVLYALTSCVSGYCSCSFYTQIQGQRWVWNIILTSALFSGEMQQPSASVHIDRMEYCFSQCNVLNMIFFISGVF